MEMEHHRTRGLWCLLCSAQVELLSAVSHSGLVVSKHGLYVDSTGSIPPTITTRTAAGEDAEHISLKH